MLIDKNYKNQFKSIKIKNKSDLNQKNPWTMILLFFN